MLKYLKYSLATLLAVGTGSFFYLGIMNNIWHIILLFLYLASCGFILFFDFSKIESKKFEKIQNLTFYLFPLLLLAFIYQGYTCWFGIINYALFFVFQILFSYLFKNQRISCILLSIFSYAFFIISEYIYLIRGIPLMPADLYATGIGAAVSDQYSFMFSSKMALASVGLILLLLIIFKLLKSKLESKNNFLKIYIAIFCLIIVIVSIYTTELSSGNLFAVKDTYESYGLPFAFILFSKNLTIKEPVSYSPAAVEEVLSHYEEDVTSNNNFPNVIVIMNESFSDLSYLGNLETNIDYLENFNNLKNESKYGNLIVSVLGGGTCNSEFEFLTGCSTAFLPENTYAYMQYIKTKFDTALPHFFKQLGFNTYAVHPFWEFAWNRTNVYSNFGFDDFISLEDITKLAEDTFYDDLYFEHYTGNGLHTIRDLISDKETYNQIIDIFEKDSESKFIFAITIQNHGGYNYNEDVFTNTVIDSTFNDYEINQYLSLIHESDLALKDFIDYFRNVDEKTVILFFGDHQPNLKKSREAILGEDFKEELPIDELQEMYTTPFFIWKNYETESEELDTISLNYLSLVLKEELGLPLTKWDKIRKNAHSQYKAINPFGVLTSDNKWLHIEDITLPEEYELIQYNLLFDN